MASTRANSPTSVAVTGVVSDVTAKRSSDNVAVVSSSQESSASEDDQNIIVGAADENRTSNIVKPIEGSDGVKSAVSGDGELNVSAPPTLTEIEYNNATIIAKARLNKTKVTSTDAVAAKAVTRPSKISQSPPKSSKSIMQNIRQTLLNTSKNDSESQVLFRKRRRTTDAPTDVSLVVELEDAEVKDDHTDVSERAAKSKPSRKKKQKRKSQEKLEEGECSSDSSIQEDKKVVKSSGASGSTAADGSSNNASLSYEEELRQRIAGRMAQRRSHQLQEGGAADISGGGGSSLGGQVADVDLLAGAGGPGNDDHGEAEEEEEEEEVTEESLWDMDYTQHLRRKELFGSHDIAPSLRLMVVGLGPTSATTTRTTGGGSDGVAGSCDPLTPLVPPKLISNSKGTKKLETLHVVTLDGADVGRLSKNGVHLPHISVSKEHARITYSSSGLEDHHYHVQDLGSNNGTYVNGARLSASKTVSDSTELGHGWLLSFGEVQLQVHLHPGHLTCNTCEPGLMAPAQGAAEDQGERSPSSLEQTRRSTSVALRQKYGLGRLGHDNSCSDAVRTSAGYQDRADQRRGTIGSDNPYEKTHVASVHDSLSSSNKGFKLLQKMGWAEGSGLGKDTTGRVEPVLVEERLAGAGLGSDAPVTRQHKTAREKQLDVVKKRYQQTGEHLPPLN